MPPEKHLGRRGVPPQPPALVGDAGKSGSGRLAEDLARDATGMQLDT
ncbi:MAG TPA: hypothetical protein VGA95_07895 [Thermodesulfobacteriota bacterium]